MDTLSEPLERGTHSTERRKEDTIYLMAVNGEILHIDKQKIDTIALNARAQKRRAQISRYSTGNLVLFTPR